MVRQHSTEAALAALDGKITTARDVGAGVRFGPMARRLGFMCTTKAEFKARIGCELLEKVPALQRVGTTFLESLAMFLDTDAYEAFRVDWCEESGEQARYSGGLFTVYYAPMAGHAILCVEAAWFADGDVEAQTFVWSKLVEEAKRLECNGIAVVEHMAEPSDVLREGIARGRLGGLGVMQMPELFLQHSVDGLWSAFTVVTSKQAKPVTCLRLLPQVQIDIAGVAYDRVATLYRGEGRTGRTPFADCDTLQAVVDRVFVKGFRASAEGTFSGTLLDQIRQQGYALSPTLSLTSSRERAVDYAVSRGTENQRDQGIVFSVAPERLRKYGPIWDSIASMESGTQVFLADEPHTIVRLVHSFHDLREAGRFLERLAEALHKSATLQGPVRRYLSEDDACESDWNFAERVIGSERFEALCSAFEFLVPTRLPDGRVTARGPYAFAFAHALPELKDILNGATGRHRNPGWDTTLFGYIAKTYRDFECFSSGSVPPEAITQAVIVDPAGTALGEPILRR